MRVLLVSSRYPLPAWRGNQVRTVEWIGALADHEVMLLCPHPPEHADLLSNADLRFYRPGVGARFVGLAGAAVSGRPFQEGLYSAADARGKVRSALEGWRPDVVVVQMVRCGWASDVVRAHDPKVPIVFDAIDSMGLHFDRAGRNAAWPARALYRSESRRCRRREVELAAAATTSVAVSDRDLKWLDRADGWPIPVAGRVVQASGEPEPGPVIVLTGNLGYRPTVRGARWFAESVWPRVRSVVPAARWVLAGARPARAIRRLERRPGISIHADVADLAPILTRATVAIAPMSSGSGVPMKVLEAMAAGVPAVVHPWAADGLIADCRRGVAVANGADRWVETVNRLLSDCREAEALGQRGRELWRRFYHPDRVAEQIRAVVEAAVSS